MVKRRISVVIISIMVSLATYAKDIHDFFISEPNQVFNLLTPSSRLDMVDYYNGGISVDMENQIYGKSKLVILTDDFLEVKLSESSITQVKILPISKRDTILVVNQIVYTPTPDSKLTIYNTKWEQLAVDKYLKLPTLTEFIDVPRKSEITMNEVEQLFPFTMIEYKLSAENNNLKAILGAKSSLTKERFEKIEPMLTDTLNYQLKGRKFKLAK